jgi:tetratricopeptide (TPR) repeat protein
VRGELDWIVMKALEKDRNRRYETANGLAADLRHYLDDEPVQACPPSTGYRLGKFARRNRAALTTALLVGLALVAGMAVSTWQAVRATAAEHRAKDERDEAVVQRQRAEARFHLAFQSMHKLRAISPNLRSVAGPDRTSKMRSAVQEDLLRFYRQIVDENEDDPKFTYEVAESCFFLASLVSPTDHKQADRFLLKALALYERVARERPDDPSVLGALANTLLFLGHWSHLYRNELQQAEASFRRSLETFERVARMHPDRTDDWYLMCNLGAWSYGDLLRGQGRTAEARELDRRILAWFERPGFDLNRFERRPGPSAMIRDDGYNGFMALGELLTRCGQPLRAIPILERARTQLIFDRDYQYYSDGLASLCRELVKDPDPAVRDRAVAVAREMVEVMSGTSPEAWQTLGLILARTGDLQGSDDAFRRLSQLSGASADTLNGISWQLVSDPQFSPVRPGCAVQVAERAVKLLTFGDKQAAATWNTLGVALYRAGDWKGAIGALERSESLAPDKHVAFDGFFLAMARWKLGEKDKAREWYDRAVQWMDKHRPKNEELRRFRAEAADLLWLNERK